MIFQVLKLSRGLGDLGSGSHIGTCHVGLAQGKPLNCMDQLLFPPKKNSHVCSDSTTVPPGRLTSVMCKCLQIVYPYTNTELFKVYFYYSFPSRVETNLLILKNSILKPTLSFYLIYQGGDNMSLESELCSKTGSPSLLYVSQQVI